MSLYQNTIFAILITDWHSVHSISVHFINLVRFGLLQSTSVYFNWIRSIRSTAIQFGPLVNSVHFDLFGPITVHLGLFSPIWSIRSTSVYLVHFRSLRSNSMYLLKNGKIQVWVESTIYYLSNINCNYMINFGYHSILLKRMRIWIITLKPKSFNCTKRN